MSLFVTQGVISLRTNCEEEKEEMKDVSVDRNLSVELWLILLNMGYYTLYEESYILEIQKSNNYETISTSKKEL